MKEEEGPHLRSLLQGNSIIYRATLLAKLSSYTIYTINLQCCNVGSPCPPVAASEKLAQTLSRDTFSQWSLVLLGAHWT